MNALLRRTMKATSIAMCLPISVASFAFGGPPEEVLHTDHPLTAIWAVSESSIVAVGMRGTILEYDGRRWSTYKTDSASETLEGVWGDSSGEYFAVSRSGSVFRRQDGRWTKCFQSGGSLSGVWGSSSSDVFAVGAHGAVIHFDGSKWEKMDAGTSVDFRTVWGFSGSNVYAVGETGLFFHYDGVLWSKSDLSDHLGDCIRGVWGSSDDDLWLAGSRSALLRLKGDETLLYKTSGSQNSLLETVRGTSSEDVFALGMHGEVFHFDGERWATWGAVPRTLMPKDVAPLPDGRVFVVGYEIPEEQVGTNSGATGGMLIVY